MDISIHTNPQMSKMSENLTTVWAKTQIYSLLIGRNPNLARVWQPT